VQGLPVDIWALGNIMFKMLTGKVPFKGTNPIQVYADINSRNIQWPREDQLREVMSDSAKDMIDKMLQLEPTKRLGHDMESIKELKNHEFFKGINFTEVSLPEYRGAFNLIEKIKKKLEQEIIVRNRIVKSTSIKVKTQDKLDAMDM